MAKRRTDQERSTAAKPAVPASQSPRLRTWLLVTGALLLTLLLLYPGAAFRGEIFGSSDAANSDAFRLAGDRSLAEGSYPLWNPYLFAGMPTFGSLSYVRFLYPPSILLMLLQESLGFPPLTWLLAHLLFGGLGMAWFLSRWRLPVATLVLGGVLWLLLPKVVAWGVHGHGTKLGAAMYLPWIVGWAWRVLDGGGARAVGMTGLLLGLQLLRGHVQITYYTLLLVGWLAVWNGLWPLEAAVRARMAVRWRRCAMLGGGLALGFLVGALLLVPVHGYADLSIRGQDTSGGGGVGMDYATGWSLAPAELGTFVLPAAAGFGQATYMGLMPFTDYPNYLGILLLALAAAGWWRGDRSLTVALAVAALLAVFVSFGRYGFGFYELLYRLLPYFNKFRIPSMILVLTGFVAIVLAARGVAAWREGTTPWNRPVVLPAVLGLAGVALLLAGAAELAKGTYASGLESLAARAGRTAVPVLLDTAWDLHKASLVRIGLILMAAASALFYSTRSEAFRRGGLAWVLLGLLAVDLAGVDRLVIHPEKGLSTVVADGSGGGRLVSATKLTGLPTRQSAESSPLARTLLAETGHDRVWPLGRQSGMNTWMADGVHSLGGYHPAKLAGYEQIRRRLFGAEPAGRLANWLGARVVAWEGTLSPADLDFLDATGLDLERASRGDGRTALHRNRAALPRARLVTAWRRASALPEGDALEPFLDAIQAGRLDVTSTVTLDREPVPAPGETANPLPAVEFLTDGLNEVVLETTAPVPALLLLADMMAPGWRVEVDGRPAELLTADLVLRAVALEAGRHTVRFHYSDPSVRTGLLLSLTGLLGVAVLILFPFLRRRLAASPGGDHE
ncbi:MAG: YfhO family protein [bacterium]|nr:YfhO family protein [bacterium]